MESNEANKSNNTIHSSIKDKQLVTNSIIDTNTSVISPITPTDEGLHHESSLDSNSLSEEIQYITNNNNEQTVTFVCSQADLPLLTSNAEGLVNFVELPEGTLELDTSLEYQGNNVLESTFDNESQITVMTTDGTERQLHLLESHNVEGEHEENVAYFRTKDDDTLDSTSGDDHILSEQLISIPTSEVVTSSHTITLPISFVSDSDISLLHTLNHLPITIGENSHEGTLSIPVSIQSDYMVHNEQTQNPEYIVVDDLAEHVLSKPEESRHILQQKNKDSKNKSFKLINKVESNKSSIVSSLKSVGLQVGRPPKIKKKHKVIGYGPTAISAQGVVQEIGSRLVTVLPRPEDLRKLMDNKHLLVAVRGNSLKDKGKHRRLHLPVIPKTQYRQNMKNMSLKKPVHSFMKNKISDHKHYDNNQDEDFTPQTLYRHYKKKKRKRGRYKLKNKSQETLVISSTGRRPGRPRKVKTLIKGPHGPKIIQTGPNNTKDSEDCHPLEKDSLSNANEGNNNVLKETENVKMNVHLDGENVDITNGLKEETDVRSGLKPSKAVKRVLPPRNRGAKYRKVIEILKKNEYDDDDLEISSEDDHTVSLSTSATIISRPKGRRGRPRKGESVMVNMVDNSGTTIIKLNESLKTIESTNSPSILIRDGSCEENEEESNKLQRKLVITFEQSSKGETVVRPFSFEPTKIKEEFVDSHVMMDPDTNITLVPSEHDSFEEETATIFIGEDGRYKQGYHCDVCGQTNQYKHDHLLHMRLRHNLGSYECNECKKNFTSLTSLEDHKTVTHKKTVIKFHSSEHSSQVDAAISQESIINIKEERNYSTLENIDNKCAKCGKTFESQQAIEEHWASCSDLKNFTCDICQLKFFSSSGLNRHRKVHERSSNNTMIGQDSFKCCFCFATFSFKSSLLKHQEEIHENNPSVTIATNTEGRTSLNSEQEHKVIERLQDKLNEGYAPKTSELYDVPKEEETSEIPSKDPFLCGICDDPFKDIDQLVDHYNTCHTGDQTLYCIICSVGCSFLYQLEKHKMIHANEEKNALANPNGLEFTCSVCNKCFKTNTELEKHSKSHIQEKPFQCSLCSASFSIKSTLDKHVLVHTGQRPYLCDICLKSFRQSAALVRHKLWTHKLKNQNKCELCGKTFFTENLLLCHLDVHGDEAKPIRDQILAKKDNNGGQSDSEEGGNSPSKEKSQRNVGNNSKVCEYCGKECSSVVALLTHKITHKLSASYKCDQCHRTFREKKYLKKHKLTHKGTRMWKCDICDKTFTTKLTLIRHSHVHLREAMRPDSNVSFISKEGEENSITSSLPTDLKCEECNLNFSHKTHYVRHKLLHFGIPLLKCGICDKLFVHKSDIIRHKVMHSFMFTCNICGRNFHKRTLYIMHKKRHLDGKPFKCDKCGKSFATSGNLRVHTRIHSGEKPYHCNICNYRCSQSGRLLKHKRMHTGEKMCYCDVCGKGFVNAESVKIHKRMHTGEKPFKCNNCEKSFTNYPALSQHLREHWKEQLYKCDDCPHKFRKSEHLAKHKLFHEMQLQYQRNKSLGLDGDANIDNPLYMCDICGRVFDRKKYLYTHQNVHSRLKVYPCNICHKQLASRLALKNHLMIHSGEMPHKCEHCEKEFRNLSNLKRHEKVHSTEEMLNCQECGETFYSRQLLKEHKQAHVNLMMINSQVDATNEEVSQQLYVFDDGISDAMDTTQQLLVNNTQQQFLVDNSQSLLVFPENESYDMSQPPSSDHENSPVDHLTHEQPMSPSVEELSGENEDLSSIQISAQDDTKIVLEVPEDDIDEEEEEEEEREIEKPHQCDVCMKSFAKKQYLTKHKYRHREVKPHTCDICGKGFPQKFEVAVHKFRHTGEKPYQCDVCHKDFRSKVNLSNHKMRHTGEYPYLCSVCNKGVSTQLQLERHVSLHTGGHPYRCDMCGKGYFQQVSLLRHLTKQHNIHSISSLEEIEQLENVEKNDQLEVMEAISTISDIPNLVNDKNSMEELVDNSKHSKDLDVTTMEIAVPGIEVELSEPEYLRTCLLETQHQDMGSKFLT